MGPPLLELLSAVEERPRVVAMRIERAPGPGGCCRVAVVVLRVVDVVHRELAPDDELLEIGRAVGRIAGRRRLHRKRDRHRRDLAEMQVRAHVRGGTRFGLAPLGSVMRERRTEIVRKPRLRLCGATLEAAHGRYAVVSVEARDQPGHVGEVERVLQL